MFKISFNEYGQPTEVSPFSEFSALDGVPFACHRRANDGRVVDAREHTEFYVLGTGEKILAQEGSDSQRLKCAYTDRLVWRPGVERWEVENAFDKLVAIQAEALKEVSLFATACRARIANDADHYKLAGWNDKSQRAMRVLAGSESENDIAILTAECNSRGKGEAPERLAQVQSQKADALATAVATIDGLESAAIAAIDRADDEESLAALIVTLRENANQQLGILLGG